jgi:acetyl esterase/lipase
LISARLTDETIVFNAAREHALAEEPPVQSLSPAALAARRQDGCGPGPVEVSALAVERTIPGPAGPVRLRLLVPDGARGVYLHLHGGGWVVGSERLQDGLLEELAVTCRLAVASVGYRLAPEQPYPAAPDDCEAAALWLVERSVEELDTDRLCIGGESAGAQLAAVTLLRLRDRHEVMPFEAAILTSGCFDLSLTPSARRWGERRLGLTTADLEWFSDRFAGDADRRDPDLSPLHADLHGLPAALFAVGTLDPLLDDTVLMSTRWRAAGNHTEADVLPGAVHTVYDSAPALARAARDRAHAFLNLRLDAAA